MNESSADAATTKHRLAALAGLAVVTMALYARTWGYGFISLDDPYYVVNNGHVHQGLTLASWRWSLFASTGGNWHPVTWWVHLLNVSVWGMNPGGHHLTSVLLHTLNTVLLAVALTALTRRFWPSWLTAAWFALHPLHVESVVWVSEVKDMMSGCFWMLALWAYARYARGPSRRRYAVVAAMVLLGLMSKPMAVTLPAVFLLLDGWPLRRLTRQNWKVRVLEKLPLVGIALIVAGVTMLTQRQAGAMAPTADRPLTLRLINACSSMILYLGDTVWPAGLSIFYPLRPDVLTWPLFMVCGGLLAAISWYAWQRREQQPWLLVGWLWYVGTLVPVIGLIQVGGQARADRYTYLPLIGIFMMLAWSLDELARRWGRRRLASLLGVASLVVLLPVTWRQIGCWESNQTLFGHAVAVDPRNVLAWNNLGHSYLAAGKTGQAEAAYKEARDIAPEAPAAVLGLATLYMQTQRLEEARGLLAPLLAAHPDRSEVLAAAGLLSFHAGDMEQAVQRLGRAVELLPSDGLTWFNLGQAQLKLGRTNEALASLLKARELGQASPALYANLGVIYHLQGELDQAEANYRQALHLDSTHEGARRNLEILQQQLEKRHGPDSLD